MKRLLLLLMLFALGLAPMLAQDATEDTTLTITLTGTLSKISGLDCLGVNGESATASAMIGESATPSSSTSDSATYTIPAGGVSTTVGAITFTNTKPWTMKVTLAATHDILAIQGPGPAGSQIKVTSTLKKGSGPVRCCCIRPLSVQVRRDHRRPTAGCNTPCPPYAMSPRF